ncbi:hypothetical protein EAI_00608 [Harpegnathos saltator]|uniref:Uncharacterized protein n=1 Tax=Harpegnathos saltator TaxID=610380 RepID=E2BMH9_HARSA|nr:hypothetical protein EAI_00608 [Harpegnathos saltator]
MAGILFAEGDRCVQRRRAGRVAVLVLGGVFLMRTVEKSEKKKKEKEKKKKKKKEEERRPETLVIERDPCLSHKRLLGKSKERGMPPPPPPSGASRILAAGNWSAREGTSMRRHAVSGPTTKSVKNVMHANTASPASPLRHRSKYELRSISLEGNKVLPWTTR